MEGLCRSYWYPLYVFVRGLGYGPPDAQDFTQEFLARLITNGGLARVSPEKGRFRSFLLCSMRHFLADERDRAMAQKRGGGQRAVSLNALDPEARYAFEPTDDGSTPDRLFDRRCAYALLERALAHLQDEFRHAGKSALFDAFKPFLSGDSESTSYAEVSHRLRLTEAAAKMTATRMRQRYRRLIREEVASTVTDPADTDQELQYLLSALL